MKIGIPRESLSGETRVACTPATVALLSKLGFETVVESGAGLNGEIGMEDILVFPILRNLTVVRGVEWPQKVMDYLLRMSEASGVPLYFDRAL